jgi:F-type H+-transporting ATPase subunit b
MEIISNNALISINETLIIQIISFLIFLFIINRIMFRPLRKIMNERENYIQQVEKDIADSKDTYRSLSHQISEEESEVRKEAMAAREALEQAGSQRADEILASSKKQIDTLRRDATRDIDAQIEKARKQLKTESESLAMSVMEKVLDRRLAS